MIRFLTFRKLLLSFAASALLFLGALAPMPAFANYAFVGSVTYTNNAGGTGTVSYTPTTGNTLIVYASANTATSGLTLQDTHNSYVFIGNVGTNPSLGMWWAHVSSSGAQTITLSGTGTYGIFVKEVSGLGTSAFITGSFQSQHQSSPGIGANLITTSSNPNVSSQPAMLEGFSFASQAIGGADPSPAVGTTLGYAGRTVGWLGTSSQQGATNEDIRITSTGTQPVTFGSVSSNQFDDFFTVAAAFSEGGGGGGPSNNQQLMQLGVGKLIQPNKPAANDSEYSRKKAG